MIQRIVTAQDDYIKELEGKNGQLVDIVRGRQTAPGDLSELVPGGEGHRDHAGSAEVIEKLKQGVEHWKSVCACT